MARLNECRLDSMAWSGNPGSAIAQLAGSNVREEARATLWERLPLSRTDACLAHSSGPMAHEAAGKEMKGHGHRQISAVQYPEMDR